MWYSGLCPPSYRRLSSRPLVTAWSFGSSGIAGWSSIRVFLCRLVSLTEILCFSCHCHRLLPSTCSDDFLHLSLACTRAAVPLCFQFFDTCRLLNDVWSFSRSLSLFFKLFCCRLEVCNIAPGDCAASVEVSITAPGDCARGRASACSGPSCESLSQSSVPILALVESRQFSAQP